MVVVSWSRRDALKLGSLGALGVVGLAVPLGGKVLAKSASSLADHLMPQPYRAGFVVPPVLQPVSTGVDDTGLFARYDIRQMAGTGRFLPNLTSPIWGYMGLAPGPTIKVPQGTRVEATFRNRLPATHPQWGHAFHTSTHLHGAASRPQYDGYASDLTPPGFAKTYQWPSWQRGRTLWYHDHAKHNTAPNVYTGLHGQYHISDPVEQALLPQGAFDVPLTICDMMFAANGSLLYDDRELSGLYGDVVLVNGKPWPVMKVQRRVYRFRVLNASVSRSYRPTLSPPGAVHVVATDGGLMPVSQEIAEWRHAPAERYEVLIDFRQYAVGQRVELRNLSNDNNRDFDHTDKIMAFDVVGTTVDTSDPTWNVIPGTLDGSETMSLQPSQATRRRQLEMKKSDVTNQWSLNGRTWDDIEAGGFREVFANPDLNDIEIWDLDNDHDGWHHPLHIHHIDFKVISRNGQAPFPYELGPKDTVYVGENERVSVLIKFGPRRGKFMIHCHNLPHEDHDMMIQYSIGLVDGEVDEDDPITADPSRWDPESGVPNPEPEVTETETSEPTATETETETDEPTVTETSDPEETTTVTETDEPTVTETSDPEETTSTHSGSTTATTAPSPTRTKRPRRRDRDDDDGDDRRPRRDRDDDRRHGLRARDDDRSSHRDRDYDDDRRHGFRAEDGARDWPRDDGDDGGRRRWRPRFGGR